MVTLMMGVLSPLIGATVQKFGARWLAILSLLGFVGANIALSQLPKNLGVLYGAAAFLGVMAGFGSPISYTRGVVTWFKRNVGTALGATLCGSSVAGIIGVPAISAVIEKYGWRMGYIAIAGFILVVALPVVIGLFRERKTPMAPSADVLVPTVAPQDTSVRFLDAVKDLRFWLLLFTFAAAAISMGAFTTHLQPLLRAQGFGAAQAAGFGSLFALSIGVGRFSSGFLVDRFWDCGVAAGMIALSALGAFGIVTLGPNSPAWQPFAAVALIGLAQGGEGDFSAYFTIKLFGIRNYAPLFSFQIMVLTLGMALGGVVGSMLFDLHGDYVLMAWGAGGCLLLSAILVLMLGFVDRKPRSRGATVVQPAE
jgi:predicted MFS family arabinose efflux permease